MKENFVKIYGEHTDSIFRYCFLRVSDRNVALDITQEVFMKYWDFISPDSSSGDGNEKKKKINNDKAFLFTIARHSIIDWYRKKKAVSLESLTEGSVGSEGSEDAEEFVIVEDGAKVEIELDAESRFLVSKIRELPHTYEQILYLRYVEDLKPKEIAEVLDIKENTVSVRTHRALDELRKITGYQIQQ